jgi:hypothetical protein
MTRAELEQAIDNATVEIDGKTWRRTGTKAEPIGIAGKQWKVGFSIVGATDHLGELVITPARYEAQEVREIAITHAQDIHHRTTSSRCERVDLTYSSLNDASVLVSRCPRRRLRA